MHRLNEVYKEQYKILRKEYLTAEKINNEYSGKELFVMVKSLVWMRIAINDQNIETRRN